MGKSCSPIRSPLAQVDATGMQHLPLKIEEKAPRLFAAAESPNTVPEADSLVSPALGRAAQRKAQRSLHGRRPALAHSEGRAIALFVRLAPAGWQHTSLRAKPEKSALPKRQIVCSSATHHVKRKPPSSDAWDPDVAWAIFTHKRQ